MIKSTEKFDMVVVFNDEDNEDMDEELPGIEEIEHALEDIPEFYIKESEFLNVVLVELGTDSVEAANKIRNSPTKIISRVVPINAVVETSLESIIKKIIELSLEKTKKNDTFRVNCIVMDNDKVKCSETVKAVVNELDKINLCFNEKDPEWIINIAIIGENTGLSVLRTSDFHSG